MDIWILEINNSILETVRKFLPVNNVLLVQVKQPLNYLSSVMAHGRFLSLQRTPNILDQLAQRT